MCRGGTRGDLAAGVVWRHPHSGKRRVMTSTQAHAPVPDWAIPPQREPRLSEMLMVASTLVKKFDMRFADGFQSDKWLDNLQDVFITNIAGPLLVVLSRR